MSDPILSAIVVAPEGWAPVRTTVQHLAAQALREDFLKKSLGKISDSSERIAKAQDFKITNEKEVGRIERLTERGEHRLDPLR